MMSVAEHSKTMEIHTTKSFLRWSLSQQHRETIQYEMHRNLGNSNSRISNLGSTEMILWYCLVAVVLVPFAMCAMYYIYHNHRSHQRALEAMSNEDLDGNALDIIENDGSRHPQNLESMEQNIQAFSKLEKQRITRIVRSSVRKHVKHFSPDELRRHCNSSSDATHASEKETVCGICLEDLIPSSGSINSKSRVCSSNNPHCRHLYHEECIVSWLAPRAQWLCPICRQEFIVKKKADGSSAATDRCGSSVCGALSTTADYVSTMTLRSPASELGDFHVPSMNFSPDVDVSEHNNLDDDDDEEDKQPSSSTASTVLEEDSSSTEEIDSSDETEVHDREEKQQT